MSGYISSHKIFTTVHYRISGVLPVIFFSQESIKVSPEYRINLLYIYIIKKIAAAKVKVAFILILIDTKSFVSRKRLIERQFRLS
jgi:hypothetical protein